MPDARIAIADANAALRSWRRAALAPIRSTVDEAATGWELLWLLAEQGPYDLVVACGRLPELSGPQVLAMARTAGLETPFVLVSPCSGDRARALVERVRRAALVDDRFDVRALLEASRGLLARRRGTGQGTEVDLEARQVRLRSVS